MKITATRSTLQAALSQVVSVIPGRTTLPILGHVRLEAQAGLTLSGTNLDQYLTVRTSAEVEDPGVVTVPAKLLAELVKTLPEGAVRLAAEKGQLVVRAGRTVVKLPTGDPEDFPKLPAAFDMADAIEVDAGHLVDMIGRTSFAISVEESRPILNGVYAHAHDGRLRFVATNGYKLACADGPEAPEGWPDDLIVPGVAMATIAKMFSGVEGPVRLARAKQYLAMVTDDVALYTRLIEGPYPHYQKVIPTSHDTTARVERVAFLRTLRRAVVMTDESRSHRVRLKWTPGQVAVSTESHSAGEFSEHIDAQVEGARLTIGYNGQYLIEILNHIPTEVVELRFGGPERAGIIQGVGDDDVFYLAMPLRLWN